MSEQIRNELLDRGLTDILHLPEIISVVSWHLGKGGVDDGSFMRPTLEAIRDLLELGYAIAGYVERDEEGILYIHSWGMSPSEAVERIERDWSALGRPPKPGEVVWLELTDAGRAAIHSLQELSQEEKELLRGVIGRRRPEMSERVSLAGQGKLNWEERQALQAALADELEEAEQGDHAEREEYARNLRVLVDRALLL